jgi:hypothetical protein
MRGGRMPREGKWADNLNDSCFNAFRATRPKPLIERHFRDFNEFSSLTCYI